MQQPQGAATHSLSGPGAERTDNASHPRGLHLPRAVPPAGKFSLQSIACLTLQGRRAKDGRGSAEKDLESSVGGGGRPGGSGRSRLLTWATLNGRGLGLPPPGAARERCALCGLGRRPRPGPRHLLFLPRARHVTAIKHVCALRRGDFLILRSLARATHSPSPPPHAQPPPPPPAAQTQPGLRPAPGSARARDAARAARHALVPSALHTHASPPPPPAPPSDLRPCQTFFFFPG